jgi:ribosomal protein S18 acetylase RimI-like enzyme
MTSGPDENRIEVEYRPASSLDSREIAHLICVAGGGIYEFLFDDMMPLLDAVDLLTIGVWGDDHPISHRNCYVAADRATNEVLGVANVFPADELLKEEYGPIPADRLEHVRTLLRLQDWGSMFLNALAVSEKCRGLGVGSWLLDWAEKRATAEGFDRLSLHVWEENTNAVKFYKARGFVELGVAPIAEHPRLVHKRGSMLMRHALSGGPRGG